MALSPKLRVVSRALHSASNFVSLGSQAFTSAAPSAWHALPLPSGKRLHVCKTLLYVVISRKPSITKNSLCHIQLWALPQSPLCVGGGDTFSEFQPLQTPPSPAYPLLFLGPMFRYTLVSQPGIPKHLSKLIRSLICLTNIDQALAMYQPYKAHPHEINSRVQRSPNIF